MITKTEDILIALKAEHKEKMEGYAKEIREFIEEHGNNNCDYLNHRKLMESYHHGAWQALAEVEVKHQ